MTENIRTLRPGLLVSLHTSLRGGVSYRTLTLEGRRVDVDGRERARWETERVISDRQEHELAIKTRSKVRSLITSVCAQSAFGLLCPESEAERLFTAIAEARTLAAAFNADARYTRMAVNVIYGRIAQDDVEAVKAITSEIRGLMDDMAEGLKTLDVKAVRDACNKAKQIGSMLSADALERVEVAVEAARKAARQIAKAGEMAAVEVDAQILARIDSARTSFLDLDGDSDSVVAEPESNARGLDLMPADYERAAERWDDEPEITETAPGMDDEPIGYGWMVAPKSADRVDDDAAPRSIEDAFADALDERATGPYVVSVPELEWEI